MQGFANLSIHGRVPVRVIKDDSVGPSEIHSNASRPRREDEDEDLRVRVETLHQDLALLGLCRAV